MQVDLTDKQRKQLTDNLVMVTQAGLRVDADAGQMAEALEESAALLRKLNPQPPATKAKK